MIFQPNDGIDEINAIQMCDNDPAFYLKVLDTFQRELAKISEQLESAISGQNADEYRILVHGIKGAADNVGFRKLHEFAKASEFLIKYDNDFDGALHRHDELKTLINASRELIVTRTKEYRERQ